MDPWKEAWSDNKFRLLLLIAFADLVIALWLFTLFLSFAESRSGYFINDPLLDSFLPADVSAVTFSLTYFSALSGIFYFARLPYSFLRLILAYTVLIFLRMACIYLLPLEPPAHIIPLQDPFLHHTFYSGRDNLKDLFFSGHTATLFLFFFFCRNRISKTFFVLAGIAVGALVIIQHVHYAIDVAAAPFFAWISFRISGWIEKMTREL